MSTFATPPSVPPAQAFEPKRNTLAIIAFICSCIFCLPPVAIAGVIMGIIALRREPRGLAIAAIVVGCLSTCLIVPLLIALLLPALGKARATARSMQTEVMAMQQVMYFESRVAEDGKVPDTIVNDLENEASSRDGYGNLFYYEIVPVTEGVEVTSTSNVIIVWSLGEDAIRGNEDDFVVATNDERVVEERNLPRDPRRLPPDSGRP
jgi:hypothetical protein